MASRPLFNKASFSSTQLWDPPAAISDTLLPIQIAQLNMRAKTGEVLQSLNQVIKLSELKEDNLGFWLPPSVGGYLEMFKRMDAFLENVTTTTAAMESMGGKAARYQRRA